MSGEGVRFYGTSGEGAKFWLAVLTQIKNRGVKLKRPAGRARPAMVVHGH
jgi:hypothetical protein